MKQDLLEDYVGCYVAIVTTGWSDNSPQGYDNYTRDRTREFYGKLIAYDNDFIQLIDGRNGVVPNRIAFEQYEKGRPFLNGSHKSITVEEAIKVFEESARSQKPILLNRRTVMHLEHLIPELPSKQDKST